MSSYLGKNLHVSVFGQSHAQAIGVSVDGLPAGEKIDLEQLQQFLDRDSVLVAGLHTPTAEKLEMLRQTLAPYVEDVQIRGTD